MGVFDRFINAIKINDYDYDEDEFYDEDELEDDYEEEKPKKGLFSKKSRDYDDYDDEDDFEEKYTRSSSKAKESTPAKSSYSSKPAAAKSAPVKKKGISPMEVNVIKPVTMEDTREIADTLLDDCTVVLNLEGIDVDLAQRVIDFTSGACYAMGGSLQKVSSYIFILTPADVEISGDITEILGSAMFSGSDY